MPRTARTEMGAKQNRRKGGRRLRLLCVVHLAVGVGALGRMRSRKENSLCKKTQHFVPSNIHTVHTYEGCRGGSIPRGHPPPRTRTPFVLSRTPLTRLGGRESGEPLGPPPGCCRSLLAPGHRNQIQPRDDRRYRDGQPFRWWL